MVINKLLTLQDLIKIYKPLWSEKLNLDDDTTFESQKGTKKYRGTRFAIDAFMRNDALFDSELMLVYTKNGHLEHQIMVMLEAETLSNLNLQKIYTTSPTNRLLKKKLLDVLTDIVQILIPIVHY